MIDGGPSRTGRSGERRPVYRAEAPQRQPEPVARAQEPAPVTRQVEVRQPNRYKKHTLMTLGIVIALVLVAAAIGWYIFRAQASSASRAIDSSKYQAVFMSGGQVYFGKLEIVNHDYVRLKHVFYIQSNDTKSTDDTGSNTKTTNASGMQLIKLGDEVHGPEDAMVINREQMLFFENLKSDGKVAQLINQYSNGAK